MTKHAELLITAKWKASWSSFERHWGKAKAGLFLGRLVPLAYEGEILVLGAPTPWRREHVARNFAE